MNEIIVDFFPELRIPVAIELTDAFIQRLRLLWALSLRDNKTYTLPATDLKITFLEKMKYPCYLRAGRFYFDQDGIRIRYFYSNSQYDEIDLSYLLKYREKTARGQRTKMYPTKIRRRKIK